MTVRPGHYQLVINIDTMPCYQLQTRDQLSFLEKQRVARIPFSVHLADFDFA